ncbi:MAG: GxxExxY protein [Acidobacteriota bacterium]
MPGRLQQEDLTRRIIKAFYKVYNTLGYGFLEKVYENALLIELKNMGLAARHQQPIKVYYGEEIVGEYFADIVVEEVVILELKAADAICKEHEAQLLNYLKATEIEIGLLLNFGPKPEFRRKIFTNDKKQVGEKTIRDDPSHPR